MQKKLLMLPFMLGSLFVVNNSFADSDVTTTNKDITTDNGYNGGVYFGVSGGYSNGKSTSLLTQKVDGTYTHTEDHFYNRYPYFDTTTSTGAFSTNAKLNAKMSKGSFAVEGGYNFNKYFGLGGEISMRSMDMTNTVSEYQDNGKSYNPDLKYQSPDGLNIFTFLVKATGYVPINNIFSLYGDVGLGFSSIVLEDNNGLNEKSDFIKDDVGTASIGAGIKLTPFRHMYVKIGANIIAMQSIIDRDNYNRYRKDAMTSYTYDYNTDIDNMQITTSKPKNIIIKEVKATIGFQF